MCNDRPKKAYTILTATTAGGAATGGANYPSSHNWAVSISQVGSSGAQTATVLIEVTNTPSVATSWVTHDTFTMSGTTTAQDAEVYVLNYLAVRAKCTAIAGTDSVLTVTLTY